MKKGPNLRWSLIQCSGGDEGDRTPDLLTASQALSQLSYAPVRRSTIRELHCRCKDNFRKTFGGGMAAAPRAARGRPGAGAGARPGRRGHPMPGRARGARPAGGRRRPPLRRPHDIPRSAVGRFSPSERFPPCARRPFRRQRSHYWARSCFRPLAHFKTMPDYGAIPGAPEHAGISEYKTAGRRFVHSAKCGAWTAGPGSAP